MSVQRPASPPTVPMPNRLPQVMILFFSLFVFVIGYWIFARAFERIDLTVAIPRFLPALQTAVPPTLREFFHWRVLRHFLPVVVGWYLAYAMAVGLVRILYDLSDWSSARRFLTQLIYSNTAATTPPVSLNSDLLYLKRDEYVVLRIGGPGRIHVRNGYVAVTELNGRFYRIHGTGRHQLERFEYVHDVLDLRLQERQAEGATFISKDGIPISATVSLQFRLASSGEQPTPTKPYPFEETAVRIAAYTQTVQENGIISRWDDAPLGIARSQLARIFSKHTVDTILTPPESSSNGTSSIPLLSIRNELTFHLRDVLQAQGIELLDVQISQIELPNDVTTQYIKYWQSQSDAQMRLSQADGEANALEEKELAQAEAEMMMIKAILEGVQRAQLANNSANMRDIVALRLVEALEKMAHQTQEVTPLPIAADVMGQIDSFRRQLGSGSDFSPKEPS